MSLAEVLTSGDAALRLVLSFLAGADYHFVMPTPATHALVPEGPVHAQPVDLRDVFGWRRTFTPSDLPERLFEDLRVGGVVIDQDDGHRLTVRVSTIGDRLHIHSAGRSGRDAVFLGPDGHRFVRLIEDVLGDGAPVARAVDIGVGTGEVALAVAAMTPKTEVWATDANPEAPAVPSAQRLPGRLEPDRGTRSGPERHDGRVRSHRRQSGLHRRPGRSDLSRWRRSARRRDRPNSGGGKPGAAGAGWPVRPIHRRPDDRGQRHRLGPAARALRPGFRDDVSADRSRGVWRGPAARRLCRGGGDRRDWRGGAVGRLAPGLLVDRAVSAVFADDVGDRVQQILSRAAVIGHQEADAFQPARGVVSSFSMDVVGNGHSVSPLAGKGSADSLVPARPIAEMRR